mgnify:CR=1 FL=1
MRRFSRVYIAHEFRDDGIYQTASVELASSKELRQRIFAGHFLTTIFEIELDGGKHRVIPRDYHLDPVKDHPLHVDFLRLGEGQPIRVHIAVRVINADASPGIKRGGAVNIVTHSIEISCLPEDIPESIDVDIAGLEINYSKHLRDVHPSLPYLAGTDQARVGDREP